MEANREENPPPKDPPKDGSAASQSAETAADSRRFEEVRERVRREAERKREGEEGNKKRMKGAIPPLRTYKDDVARTIRKQQESYVSVLAAETKRRAGQARASVEEKTRISQFILIASAVLFAAGIGSFGLFFLLSQKTEAPALPSIPSHIFTEEKREIDISGKERIALMRALVDEGKRVTLPLGSLSHYYLTEMSLGVKRLVTPQTFLSRLEVRAPESFLRSLKNMTLGVHVASGIQPFLILGVSSFETAFSGMLNWEDDMHEDLAPLFGSPVRRVEGGNVIFSVNTPFIDKVIRNRDARILRDSNDIIVFLYAFLDKETIVITTNELTFNEIVTRFVSSQL